MPENGKNLSVCMTDGTGFPQTDSCQNTANKIHQIVNVYNVKISTQLKAARGFWKKKKSGISTTFVIDH